MTLPRVERAAENPWRRVLRAAVTVQVFAMASCTVIALIIAVVASPINGGDFIVGGVIAGLPYLWFLARGSASRAKLNGVALALGKFTLSATGFAIWFGLRPEANPITTLLGTATYIVVVALGMVIASRQV